MTRCPEGVVRRRRRRNVCQPNWAIPLPGHEPGRALNAEEGENTRMKEKG